jgi:hypothetical protein
MKTIIFYDMAPCRLVYKHTDVSEQPAEEEVYPDDEEKRYFTYYHIPTNALIISFII